MFSIRRGALAGAACMAAGVVLLAALPIVGGRPAQGVRVSWFPMPAADRVAAESQLRLSEPRNEGRGWWAYIPLDTAPSLLRRIVEHPKVRITEGIDTRRMVLSNGLLTARRGGMVALPPIVSRAVKGSGYLLMLVASALWLYAALRHRGWSPPRPDAGTIGTIPSLAFRTLQRAIPIASAESVACLRVALGVALFAFVTQHPVDVPEPLNDALRLLAVLFTVGAASRLVFPALVGAFLYWAWIHTTSVGHHPFSSLCFALVCLLPVPWSDAWSVDALVLRPGAGGGSSRRYGYAAWILLVVLGLTFAAAAASKLRGGVGWILNGTVRYHFATDLPDARVPWGIALVEPPGAAIAASAVAVAIEAAVITAAFVRSDAYRLLAGAGAAALLSGFALFQGVLWPGWWMLLLGFLPWHRLRPRPPAIQPALTGMQVALATMAIVVHAVAWARGIEARPLISAYDMYATTYESDEAYEARIDLTYRVAAVDATGGVRSLDCTFDEPAVAEMVSLSDDGRSPEPALSNGCAADWPGVAAVMLEGDRYRFNWDTRAYEWRRAVDRVGPLRLR